jgi:hypothetical protein
MTFVNTRIIYAVMFYILLIMLVVVSKPAIIFETNGSIKRFGLGEDRTMFSMGVFSIVLAIISYYIFCMVDMIFTK